MFVKIKKLFGDIETDYLDGFQYKDTKPSEVGTSGEIGIEDPNEVAEMKLRIIPTAEGYYDALSNQYIYNFTDHLGNVRLSYTDTNKDGVIQPRRYNVRQCDGPWDPMNQPNCVDYWQPGEIVEVNNYYPFGLLHDYTATTQNAYQYKYNGKELQESGMYDYGARFYMPDLGRWGVADPLAEKMMEYSIYNYAFNNPLRFIDPDGRQGTDWILQNINGVSTWTYIAGVKTVAQAEKAGYKNVAAIYSRANIIGEGFMGTGKYSYSLNTDGSATDNISGNTLGGSFSTPAGTNISTGSYIGQWNGENSSVFGNWGALDSFLGKLSYNVTNSFYLGFQVVDTFNLMGGKHMSGLTGQQIYTNLDGSNQYNEGDRAVAFTSTFNPLSSELKVAGLGERVLPKTAFKLFDNASNPSQLLKGTTVSEMAPAVRANIYKYFNTGVNTLNSVSMFKLGTTSIIKPLSVDKHKN